MMHCMSCTYNYDTATYYRNAIIMCRGQQALSEGVFGVLHNNSNAYAIVGGPYYLDVETPYQPGHEGAPLTHKHYGWMDTW